MKSFWKRLFAVGAFVAGGLCAELATPLHCIQLPASRMWVKRRRESV